MNWNHFSVKVLLAIGVFAACCIAAVAIYAVIVMGQFVVRQDCILVQRNRQEVAESTVVIQLGRGAGEGSLGPMFQDALYDLEQSRDQLLPENIDARCGSGQTGVLPWQ